MNTKRHLNPLHEVALEREKEAVNELVLTVKCGLFSPL